MSAVTPKYRCDHRADRSGERRHDRPDDDAADLHALDPAVREQAVDQQPELVGRPLAQRLQPPALTSVAPSNTPSTMLVLPTSIAKQHKTSPPRWTRRTRRRTLRTFTACSASSWSRFRANDFPGNDALDPSPTRTSSAPRSSMPAVTPSAQPADVVRATRAPTAPARAAPGVENSIEPAVEQIVVARAPARPASRRAQSRAIDRASELGFERRRAIAQLRREARPRTTLMP